MTDLNLEQLRKQAKEGVRSRRTRGEPIKLSDAQLELAREHGFASWPKLVAHLERAGKEQPFRTDLEYYEGRAEGIATVNGVTLAEARRDLAERHRDGANADPHPDHEHRLRREQGGGPGAGQQ